MIHYSPFWAITESAARTIEAGLPALVDKIVRIETARVSAQEVPMLQTQNGIGVIDVQGVMLKRESVWTRMGYATSMVAVERAIAQALDDKEVRAIVLNIDSPGGTVDGIHSLTQAVGRANRSKPVIAHADGLMASAGYWLASQTSAIYASPGSEIGSIGVRLLVYDLSRAFENGGIEAIAIDTGPLKSAGAMGTEITQEQRDYFQSQVDTYFADFLGDVRRGRKLNQSQAKAVSAGGTFIGAQAIEAGLVDGIQSLDETLRMARRMTGKSNQSAKARARVRDIEAAVV